MNDFNPIRIDTDEQLTDVGVIIGRFQTDILTDGHIKLIEFVKNRHRKVIIMLGVVGMSPVPSTKANPLDFETRRLMILEKFSDVIISYVKDMKYDSDWSKQLDSKINDLLAPNETVSLYGSRSSFIPHYTGQFKTISLHSDIICSATNRRKEISLQTKASVDYRQGVISGITHQFDTPQATVDTLIYDIIDGKIKILLGRKPYESHLFQFIGGYATVSSLSYEEDALREVKEECSVNIEVDPNIEYITSSNIDSWLYRSEVVKIKTILYCTKYLYGTLIPSDDIDELNWFDLDDLISNGEEMMVSEHLRLLRENVNKFLLKIKAQGYQYEQ